MHAWLTLGMSLRWAMSRIRVSGTDCLNSPLNDGSLGSQQQQARQFSCRCQAAAACTLPPKHADCGQPKQQGWNLDPPDDPLATALVGRVVKTLLMQWSQVRRMRIIA